MLFSKHKHLLVGSVLSEVSWEQKPSATCMTGWIFPSGRGPGSREPAHPHQAHFFNSDCVWVSRRSLFSFRALRWRHSLRFPWAPGPVLGKVCHAAESLQGHRHKWRLSCVKVKYLKCFYERWNWIFSTERSCQWVFLGRTDVTTSVAVMSAATGVRERQNNRYY